MSKLVIRGEARRWGMCVCSGVVEVAVEVEVEVAVYMLADRCQSTRAVKAATSTGGRGRFYTTGLTYCECWPGLIGKQSHRRPLCVLFASQRAMRGCSRRCRQQCAPQWLLSYSPVPARTTLTLCLTWCPVAAGRSALWERGCRELQMRPLWAVGDSAQPGKSWVSRTRRH
ncbi:hypothetical protein K466DRAFT_113882 [Polyporus arcularius HHB13444]|uniref:Uncharacterized protein n=1 Tax=Polyporus arcularius HHB13444 TaxID=1314778 RepID=A0A5C3PDR1_9APHY|nr:hypothetical protein K466DRAFT_113882 [Polyporus arcularius HHB13444]